MEIAKQELIVQAREAASRVLQALSGVCGSPAPPCRGPPAGAPHHGPWLSCSRSANVGADGLGRPEARAVPEAEGAVCEGPGGGGAGPGRGGGPEGSTSLAGRLWGVLQRRRAARQEELDEDFSYARELRDRERRLRALEEQLERKARWVAGGTMAMPAQPSRKSRLVRPL